MWTIDRKDVQVLTLLLGRWHWINDSRSQKVERQGEVMLRQEGEWQPGLPVDRRSPSSPHEVIVSEWLVAAGVDWQVKGEWHEPGSETVKSQGGKESSHDDGDAAPSSDLRRFRTRKFSTGRTGG